MKILVFSDIHGNKYALQSLIDSEDFKSSDLKVFLGDFIALGTQTNEVVDIIKSNDIISVLGNNDSYVVNGLSKEELREKSSGKIEHMSIVKTELSKENIEYLQSLPKYYEINEGGKSILFCHYAWESDTEVKDDPIYRFDGTIEKVFKEYNYDYIIYGHIHTPYRTRDKGKVIYGVGSTGAMYPGRYIMINIDSGRVNIKRKFIDYDYKSFKEDMSKFTDRSRKFFYHILDREFGVKK